MSTSSVVFTYNTVILFYLIFIIGMQRLLPYLPNGDAEAAAALLIISASLEWLLAADAADLWAAVRSDASVITFLDSFLRAALRPFDDGFQELSNVDLSVWRHSATLFAKLYEFLLSGAFIIHSTHQFSCDVMTVCVQVHSSRKWNSHACRQSHLSRSIINSTLSFRCLLLVQHSL